MNTKEIVVHNIFTSSKHNYFTREKFDVGNSPTIEHRSIELVSGQGLKDDRFEFSKYPVTFFSLEVAKEVSESLELELDLKLFRRNIIVSGVHLNSLIGKRFFIDGVEFEGLAHCSPCTWMNAVMKKGVYQAMKGRGGLRAKVIHGGILYVTRSRLSCESDISEDPLKALSMAKIPK